MKAISINKKSLPALKTALKKTLSTDFRPTLAIVFSSKSQDLRGICQWLDEQDIAVFGCTTHGEFIDENLEQGSCSILLLDMPRDYFQILLEEYPQQNYREVATRVAQTAKAKFENPAFVIGISHTAVDGEEILRGFEDVAGKNVQVFGGGAGDDYAIKENFVFTTQQISKCGLICLALDQSKVDVQGIATCGWKAVGTEKTITKSEGNHVYTIDGEPAVDITAKYGGLENVTPENKNIWVELGCNLPLQLQREDGDPVMRGGLVVDWTDRSFYCSGTVPQGTKVRFSVPPDWDVIEEVVQGVKQLKANTMPEADALLVFSCAGRIMSLGPLMEEEVAGIKKVWNVPMAGMFSNSELGRGKGGNLEMHALATCCIALKEK